MFKLTIIIIAAISFLFPLCANAESLDQRLVTLIAQNRLHEAKALLNSTNPTRNDQIFFQGRVHKANGQYEKAIAIFKNILDRDPNYINARRELAHTLLLNKEYTKAAREFRLLLRSDTDENMKATYRNFLRVIEREKPYGVNLSFSILPSTNINRATTNETFDPDSPALPTLQIDNRAKSGTGVLLGFGGYYQHRISNRDRFVFNADISARRYPDKIFDSTTKSLAVSFERQERSYAWSLQAYQRATDREDNDDNITTGLSFGVSRQVSPKTVLYLSSLQEYRSYNTTDSLDGTFHSTSASLSHNIRSDLTLAGGGRFTQYTARNDVQSYVGGALFGQVSKMWENQTRIGLGLEIGQRNYKGDYPLTTRARDDEYYRINLSLSNNRINFKSFTPQLSCAYTSNESNIEFFEYNVTECEISFRKTF